MEAPLSGTCEAGWRASGLVGSLSGTCEAGWRASRLVGSDSAGCGSVVGVVGDVGLEAPPCCLVGVCPMGLSG